MPLNERLHQDGRPERISKHVSMSRGFITLFNEYMIRYRAISKSHFWTHE
uniref:Uncharacterized protein n=1 Tax=Rhizophora mucronata TaxID=61149 RepID=A0A2P2NTS5_RHIMU